MIRTTRGQAWGFDLIIACTIFFVAFIFFFLYTLNSGAGSDETLPALFATGDSISGLILSEGSPSSWTNVSVVRIGILSDGSVNDTKLAQWYSMSQSDYNHTRSLFSTRYEYFVNFSVPMNITGVGVVSGVGKPYWTNNVRNLVKITRFTSYERNPVTVYVYVWE